MKFVIIPKSLNWHCVKVSVVFILKFNVSFDTHTHTHTHANYLPKSCQQKYQQKPCVWSRVCQFIWSVFGGEGRGEARREECMALCCFCSSGWNNEIINVNFGFGMKKMMSNKLLPG